VGDIKNWVEEFKVMASAGNKKFERDVRSDTRKH
jgi:hypothetical protein